MVPERSLVPDTHCRPHCSSGVPDEDQLFKKPRQVVHKNTRFLRDPFSQALSRSQLQQAAALNAQVSYRPCRGYVCW